LSNFFAFLKKHKLKIFVLLISVVVWALVLFPFGDLSDLVSDKVATLTQNQVFLQFSRLRISLWPLGFKFADVSVDTPFTGALSANELTVAPSPASLFSRIPAGTLAARGLFHGDVDVSVKSAGKSEAGNERQMIEIHAAHLNLQDLKDVSQLPLLIKGQLSVDATALADLSFSEQPESDIVIKAEKFELPSQTINSAMGPINVPDLKLSSVELKGHLNSGKFIIDEGHIGRESDELRGNIKGEVGFLVRNQGSIQPQIGGYSLDVDLTIKTNLEERLNLFLVAVSQYKTSVGDSSRYQFRLTAQNPAFPPSMTALH
jgi:type II secretion system protein N